MAEKHSPRERLQLFRIGWQRGAGSKAIPDNLKDDPDFQYGYEQGRIAFNTAMAHARMKYGAPPPNFLRMAKEDLEEQIDEEMFGNNCTCHLMDGGKMCAACLAVVHAIAAKGMDDG